jgi:hypothetical protein
MFPGGKMLSAAALPWFVSAWIATVAIVSVLIYLIVRAVLGKTDPQRLPEVLRALTPLLHGLARALAKLSAGLPANETPQLGTPTKQTGDTSDDLPEKAS